MPDGRLGTLEAGKIADMVIVKGNPLEDITLLQHADNIRAVVKDGEIYSGLLDQGSPYRQTAGQLDRLLKESLCAADQ